MQPSQKQKHAGVSGGALLREVQESRRVGRGAWHRVRKDFCQDNKSVGISLQFTPKHRKKQDLQINLRNKWKTYVEKT